MTTFPKQLPPVLPRLQPSATEDPPAVAGDHPGVNLRLIRETANGVSFQVEFETTPEVQAHVAARHRAALDRLIFNNGARHGFMPMHRSESQTTMSSTSLTPVSTSEFSRAS